MDGGWIADLMKRVVSLDDLEAIEEPEQSKAQRADEVDPHRSVCALTLRKGARGAARGAAKVPGRRNLQPL